MNKRIIKNIAGILMVVLIFSAIVTALNVGGPGNHSSSSFILFKDGDTCFVQNGDTGLIDFSVDNHDSQAVDYAIDNIGFGGEIFFKAGHFTSYNDFLVDCRGDKHITFSGEGWCTILESTETNGMDWDTMSFQDGSDGHCSDITIQDMQIICNTDNGLNGCIDFDNGNGFKVLNCKIVSDKQGITFHGNSPDWVEGSIISGCHITAGTRGLYILTNNRDNIFTLNTITGCEYGIYIHGAKSCTVSFNNIHHNKYGILSVGCLDTDFINNDITLNDNVGLYLRGSTNNKILANNIYANSQSQPGSYYGCYVLKGWDGSYNNYLQVKDNILYDDTSCQKGGLGLYYSDYAQVKDNTCYGNVRNQMYFGRGNTNLLEKDNAGYDY